MTRIAALLFAAAVLAGCMPYNEAALQEVQDASALQVPTRLGQSTDGAVDAMLTQAPLVLQARGPAVVGSIADIRDMSSTTPFGNVIAELVRSRLVERGVPVTDLRLRREVRLEPGVGEMTLSRSRSRVYPPPPAAEIVTGSYAVASGTVYVSLKMIEADNARILAAGDFVLPRNDDVDRLLRTGFASAN